MSALEPYKINNGYVLGFIFDLYAKKVLLIKKNKPTWQAGFFNGIGGKIEEDNYHPSGFMYATMVRECEEETSVKTHALDWRHFCTMKGINCPDGDWNVYCLSTYLKTPDDKYKFKTNEKETVIWFDIDTIHTMLPKLLGNIPWLVSMALDHRINGNFEPPVIEYSGGFSLPLMLKDKLVL